MARREAIDRRPRREALDRKAQEKTQALEAIEERKAANDARVVMGTLEGRRFVWRLMLGGGVFDSAEPGVVANPQKLAAFEGRRSLAIGLKRQLDEVSPEESVLMIQEAIQAAAEAKAQRAATASAAPNDREDDG